MKKLCITALLLLAMVFAVAACNRGGNDPAPATPVPATPAPTAPPVAQDPTPPDVAPPDVELDPIELNIWYIFAGHVWDDSWRTWQQIAEHTGVTLTGVADPVNTNVNQAFDLQAVDGFPAHIYGGTLAPRFMDFGMQGAFIPLQDLIPIYAPNFYAIMNAHPYVREGITAPDGNIYHLPNLNDVFETFAVSKVYWAPMHWLEMLDLPVPDTIEELEATLFAFRDYLPELTGNEYVVPWFWSWGWQDAMSAIFPMFGARRQGNETGTRIGVMEDRDEVYHIWLTDEFRFALENFSRWFGEGLIDPELLTRTGDPRVALWTDNQGGFTHNFPMSTGNLIPQMREGIEGFQMMPMYPVIGTDGRRVSEVQRAPMNNNGWAITPHNPYPGRTLMMMDFLYTGHGRHLLNFGPYGITWEYVDGEPTFLPYVHEHGLPVLEVIRVHNGAVGAFPYMADLRYELAVGTAETTLAQEMYAPHRGFSPRMTPALNMTVDERALVLEIRPTLNAFLNENIQLFIVGDWEDIAGQWDDFVAGAIALGAQEYVDAHQAAFARFMAN